MDRDLDIEILQKSVRLTMLYLQSNEKERRIIRDVLEVLVPDDIFKQLIESIENSGENLTRTKEVLR